MLLYANTFNLFEIRITTSNGALIKRIPILFNKAFGIQPAIKKNEALSTSKTSFCITTPADIRNIFSCFGYEPKNMALHLNLSVIEESCCKAAFLRGAFLAGGSVTNPEKEYHFELETSHSHLNKEVTALLMDIGMKPKASRRKYNYLIYFKESSAIEDFLTTIGAPVSAMGIMQAKVEKDLRNTVNRKVNCETANLGKTIDAAGIQLDAIKLLEDRVGLENLPKPLFETAIARRENPDLSLKELALTFDPPMSKAGLNHRLKKLIELSEINKQHNQCN